MALASATADGAHTTTPSMVHQPHVRGDRPGWRATTSTMSIADRLVAAMGELRGIEAANKICATCVTALGVDAAAISLVYDGGNVGTLGASSAAARRYDEVQFLTGQGPCLESVAINAPVVVADLAARAETRWPLYRSAMLEHRIRAVAAIPVHLSGEGIGALNFFYTRPTPVTGEQLAAATIAASLARLPLLDVLGEDIRDAATDPDTTAWIHLHDVTRVEIAQATGMIMAQLDLGRDEALLRLRAHAYATATSPSHVARAIIARHLRLDPS